MLCSDTYPPSTSSWSLGWSKLAFEGPFLLEDGEGLHEEGSLEGIREEEESELSSSSSDSPTPSCSEEEEEEAAETMGATARTERTLTERTLMERILTERTLAERTPADRAKRSLCPIGRPASAP